MSRLVTKTDKTTRKMMRGRARAIVWKEKGISSDGKLESKKEKTYEKKEKENCFVLIKIVSCFRAESLL